ncbi:MAG: hypothetical protein FJ096_13945 [Deltaproteobacteria bacterium]|nr:hypothetical protein [Deltaproteobacteria bacterium]
MIARKRVTLISIVAILAACSSEDRSDPFGVSSGVGPSTTAGGGTGGSMNGAGGAGGAATSGPQGSGGASTTTSSGMGPTTTTTTVTASTGAGGATASSSAMMSASSSGGAPDFGYDPSGSGGSGPSCAATEVKGKKPPVDIIFAVDTSGSMSEEIAQVKANINGSFAAVLGAGDLDYRVVMVATKGTSTLQVCVAEPLGGPNCGSNLPLFRSVPQSVASTNALSLLLSTYDSATVSLNWSSFVRPEATKAFIVVTDDNSSTAAATFDTQLLAKAPAGMFGTAQKRKYVMYGIIGIDKNNPALKCGTAVNNGSVYQTLVTLTGGAQFSECETDYSPIFKSIANKVVAKLSCGYTLPKNDPNGQAIDSEKVVVKLVDAMNQTTTFTKVGDASKCVGNEWYYEDNLNPEKIVLCPSACTTVQNTTGAQIKIDVGCLQG